MRMRKMKPLYPALLLLMMLVLSGCKNDTQSDGKKMPADWMDISTENDKEFTMIRVKDDYLEIRSGEANAFVYTEPEGSYPELEDGQCAKVVADVNIYEGGEAGYMGNIFIKDLKSCTPVTYMDVAEEYGFPDAGSSNFDRQHYILQYKNEEELYLLLLNRNYVEAYRDGVFFAEFDLDACKGEKVTPFFEKLNETSQANEATASEVGNEQEESQLWSLPGREDLEPVTDIAEMFASAQEDAYQPFQDPEKSFCWNLEGYAAPVLLQSTGTCETYSAVTCMNVNYQIAHHESAIIDPLELLNRFYVADPDDPDSGEGEYIKAGNPNDYGSNLSGMVFAFAADPYDGFLLKDLSIRKRNVDGGEAPFSTEEVKEAIKNFGPVQTSFSWDHDKCDHGLYTMSASRPVNHWVAIVGWDDDFPAEYFATMPKTNGAWLIQNSRSKSWGNSGYAWVSYEFPVRNIVTSAVTKDYAEAAASGINPNIGVKAKDAEESVAATVFHKEGNLGGVGFYAKPLSADTPVDVTIEVYDGAFGELLASADTGADCAGYHVAEFKKALPVTDFTVVLKVKNGAIVTEGSSYYYEVARMRMTEYGYMEGKIGAVVHTEQGTSYYLVDGEWLDATDKELLTKYESEPLPPGNELTCLGEPTLVALFK